MDFNININQKALIDLGVKISLDAAAMLATMHKRTGLTTWQKKAIIEDGKTYYVFEHGCFADALPLLFSGDSDDNLKHKVIRITNQLIENGLIERHPNCQKLRKSYYCFTEKSDAILIKRDESITVNRDENITHSVTKTSRYAGRKHHGNRDKNITPIIIRDYKEEIIEREENAHAKKIETSNSQIADAIADLVNANCEAKPTPQLPPPPRPTLNSFDSEDDMIQEIVKLTEDESYRNRLILTCEMDKTIFDKNNIAAYALTFTNHYFETGDVRRNNLAAEFKKKIVWIVQRQIRINAQNIINAKRLERAESGGIPPAQTDNQPKFFNDKKVYR